MPASSTKRSFISWAMLRGEQGCGAAERHLAARPASPACLPRLPVGAWARQPPWRSCFWKPEKPRRCPCHLPEQRGRAAVSPTPAAQPGCQPANYSHPIAWHSALGAMRSRRQRCAGESRGGVCAQGGLCSWVGRVGGQEAPWVHPRSMEPRSGSVSPMLHAGKNYRLRPESPATHAVFLVQRCEFLSAQGTAFISTPSQPLLGNTPLRCSVQGLQLLMIPAFTQQPRWQRVLSPAGSPGLSAAREPFPLSPPLQRVVGKWPGWRNGPVWGGGCSERGRRAPCCCAAVRIRMWLFSPHQHQVQTRGSSDNPELHWVHRDKLCRQHRPRRRISPLPVPFASLGRTPVCYGSSAPFITRLCCSNEKQFPSPGAVPIKMNLCLCFRCHVLCSKSRAAWGSEGVQWGSEGVASLWASIPGRLGARKPWRSSQQPDGPHATLALQAGDFSETSDASVTSLSLPQKPWGEGGCGAGSPQDPPPAVSLGDGDRSHRGQCCPRIGLVSSVLHTSDTRWSCRSLLGNRDVLS